MSKAENISHLCQMIRGNVYHAWLSNMSEDYGYMTRLKKVASEGGFATRDTLEILSLQQAEAEATALAAEIAQLREQLMANGLRNAA